MTYPTWNLIRGAVDANTEPISLAVAKLHVKEDGNDQNTYISALCTTARQRCEHETNRALVNGSFTLKLDAFPCGRVVLPVGVANVANVVISYVDGNGQSQTWANTDYRILQAQDSFSELAPVYGTVYPTTRDERHAVTITFESGTQTVDDALKHGMLLFIGHLFEHREAVVVGSIATPLPMAVDALWGPYKLVWF